MMEAVLVGLAVFLVGGILMAIMGYKSDGRY
jgi:hypothetical protein